MKERNLVFILTAVFLLAGFFVFYAQANFSGFNFDKSEIAVNGSHVTETLNYLTNKGYHTLYRNFQSNVAAPQDSFSNSIVIENVSCSSGTPYFNTINSCYNNNSFISSNCLAYTEKNEYGCSFGNVLGFSQGKNYQIGASYNLNPENLFLINGNYYIKFIAYSGGNHKKLILGKNLIVGGGAVANNKYLPDEQVIIYIPYTGNVLGFNAINQTGFEFDNKFLKHLFTLLFSLGPGILFFLIWLFFGRKKEDPNIPERLSMYPSKRKAWEVAAFFNPPFGIASKNIVPALMTDFYNRKIIDIKASKKEIYLKIKDYDEDDLDGTERNFMDLLKFFRDNSKKDKDYFLLKNTGLGWKEQYEARKKFSLFFSEIGKSEPQYLSRKGSLFAILLFFVAAFAFTTSIWTSVFVFFSGIIILVISGISSILINFKEELYSEYQKWQAFKKFLSDSSLKLHKHEGTIIWGDFLVYATSLGVAKRVLKELKNQGLVTEDQYNTYFVISSPAILASATGLGGGSSGGGAGGFGGAGAGGIGGGGGGGR